MPIRKTEEEVQAEIVALRALREELPAASEETDGALRVLETRMSHDDVYDSFSLDAAAFEGANEARM